VAALLVAVEFPCAETPPNIRLLTKMAAKSRRGERRTFCAPWAPVRPAFISPPQASPSLRRTYYYFYWPKGQKEYSRMPDGMVRDKCPLVQVDRDPTLGLSVGYGRAAASSSLINASNALSGWAPLRKIPLMKKAGVPLIPKREPSWLSC